MAMLHIWIGVLKGIKSLVPIHVLLSAQITRAELKR